jgi:anionic cell wall polymer biosynthesis LytR-Cps2A-Psr (LCP) family protein
MSLGVDYNKLVVLIAVLEKRCGIPFYASDVYINAMGGIRVYSPVEFDSSLRPYHYKKGWNDLGGRQALFFARERHAFEGQDSIRVENQQRVMKAVLDKLMTSRTLLTKYPDILKAGADDLETDMSVSEMQQLVKMQLADLGEWEIDKQKIEGDYDMDYVASLTQEQQFLVYKAHDDSVEKVRNKINSIMNPSEEELQLLEEEKKKETAMSFINKILKRDENSDKQENSDKEGK